MPDHCRDKSLIMNSWKCEQDKKGDFVGKSTPAHTQKESKCKVLVVKEADNLRKPKKAFVAGPQ